MLKGISPLLSPRLLSTLCEMGHGDELVLADAHFPGQSIHNNVIRADGLKIDSLLDAILPLFELDQYVDAPLLMMAATEGDQLDPTVEDGYMKAISRHVSGASAIKRIDRFEFYERTKACYAVVMTGETKKYGNILLKKGVPIVANTGEHGQ